MSTRSTESAVVVDTVLDEAPFARITLLVTELCTSNGNFGLGCNAQCFRDWAQPGTFSGVRRFRQRSRRIHVAHVCCWRLHRGVAVQRFSHSASAVRNSSCRLRARWSLLSRRCLHCGAICRRDASTLGKCFDNGATASAASRCAITSFSRAFPPRPSMSRAGVRPIRSPTTTRPRTRTQLSRRNHHLGSFDRYALIAVG